MEFLKFSESYSPKVTVIIAPVFEDFTPADTLKFIGESSALANGKKSGFSGMKGETFDTFDNKLGKRVILIGLGKKTSIENEILRRSYFFCIQHS